MSRAYQFALLGDPVAHSLSPAMHGAAFKLSGLRGDYSAIRADRSRLERALEELRAGSLDGVNVTMPLKHAAWQLAEETTRQGTLAVSVNALRYRDESVEGHSTDTVAFEEILGTPGFDDIADVLVLGSGGSAGAALAALAGRNVYLSSRNQDRAQAVARFFDISGVVRWEAAVAGALVINATPVGMSGEELPDPVLGAASALIDLPYGPSPTPAMETGSDMGIPAVDGIEFLALQAAASFQWWTGVHIDFELLTAAARNA